MSRRGYVGHYNIEYKKCNDSRPCFAKSGRGTCGILSETYEDDGQCPFCKEKIEDKAVRKNERFNRQTGGNRCGV